MNSQLIDADERLATVFSHYYCVQLSPEEQPVTLQLMPNYEMLLVFNLGPAIPIALGGATYVIQKTAVLGPLQKMLTYELPAGTDLIVVNFTLDGFYRLLGVSMQELKTGDWHDPDVLLNKNCFSELWEQLAPLSELADRISLLNAYALTFVAPTNATSDSLRESIPYFRDAVVDPIKVLAETQQVSARRIQMRFQTHLGYSAKELTRFLRFRNLLNLLTRQHPQPPDWLNLVLTFGYHDHSHLIKDFQYYLGLTPRQFLKQLAQGNVCISKTGRFY
ncbi:helix-turn-helix domain-containing protein [Larkinella humicola]|uniref:AraC family transcriptional regulator n=1 Tax=Larkinella humicola TaxID=2607654 RepID=A0A5N1J424_9BACT|nr:helix-turn-helix domain-containing protein [Larkinella humicola]KAA9345467.1 AraC family transcriptional regulator [Larkinella humicola]